ncbi:heparin lyase I family protein [uncultured Roseobacter sp.]|uniref:heparin lyase I family protein n=1 Tax=uncultured Roseobacter sp. TaxID=114847 RepID=UPI002629400C|nr:heparin lyase I family protein [uncultured Roseobacter sp.]
MRVRLILSAIVVLFFTSCMTGSGRLETSRSLNNTQYGYQFVASPVRAGEVAQRFEVRPGDCGRDNGWDDCANNRERSEVTVGKEIVPGTVHWIAHSIYLPKDFYSSPRVKTSMGQIHQRGGPSGKAGGLPSFPPLLQIDAKGNRIDACLHILTGPANNVRDVCRDLPLTTVSAMRGKWTDIMIHLDARENGLLEIYLNGERKARTLGFIRFSPQEYYVKYGLYRSFVSRHGGPMPTQVAFYDEVRIGADRASVEISADRPVD